MTGGLVGLVLAVSACSSSGGTPTGSASTSTTAAPTKAADLALAKKGLIVLTDLPSGWTTSGKITSGSGSGDNVPTAKIATCLGVPQSEINSNWPTENSPDFNNPGGTLTVSDEVETFPTPGRAKIDFSTFSNPKTPSCVTSVLGPLLAQAAQKGGGAGTSVGTITATRQTFPGVGDESGEIELDVPISASGASTTLYIDLLVITVGRLESTLSLESPGSQFDQTEAQQVAAAAVRHMA